jgi:sulfur relay (sulfurtransferase) DsrF/TusC family protein
MAQKHVLITINQAPYGNIYYTEGLRAAVGVTSGIEENTVTVVYMGDGAYFALKGVDRKDTSKYIETLEKQGCKLMVEKEAMLERGIAENEVAGDVNVIPRSDVLKLIQGADQTIGF